VIGAVFVIGQPWCRDAQLIAADDRWRDIRRLCGVPISFGTVKPWAERGIELVILRPFVQMVPPVFIAKPG
jgi:hypothetical protein